MTPYVSRVGPPYRVRRLTIIGESPNSQGVEKYDTRSGQRLLDMMGGKTMPWHNIHGAEPPKWSKRVARARIEDWLAQNPLESEPLLLLGRKVAHAFGIPGDAEWLEWYVSPAHRHPMILFPHTSPRNTWWNNPKNETAARDLLMKLVNGKLPNKEKQRDEKA